MNGVSIVCLFFLFLIGNIAPSKAQLVPIDVESMLENTGLIAPMFCNAPLNSYQVVMINGLSYTTDATLVLQCTGCTNTTLIVPLGALDVSGVVTITAPNSCLITNRYCRLLMYVTNVLTEDDEPEQVLVSEIESTCGVVPPNDYTAGCSWIDFACQMTNGEWYHYGPALTMYQAFVFFIFMLGTITLVVFESNSRQFRLSNIAKASGMTAGLNQNTYAKSLESQFMTNSRAPALERPLGFFNGSAKGKSEINMSSSSSSPHSHQARTQGAAPVMVYQPSTVVSSNNAVQSTGTRSSTVRNRGATGSVQGVKEVAMGQLLQQINNDVV